MSSVNQPILDFKSASIYAIRLVLQSFDTNALLAALQSRLDAAGDFFDGEPVVIDALALEQSPDWQALAALLFKHGMPIVGVAAGAELHDSIRAAGLAIVRLPVVREASPSAGSIHRDPPSAIAPASGQTAAAAAHEPPPQPSASTAPPEAAIGGPAAGQAAMRPHAATNMPGERSDEAAAPTNGPRNGADPEPSVAAAPGSRPTLLVDRSLRSGQKVYARDSDLIVVGMVSAGAEVIADGNIHVYGPLRGKAMAGARGDEEARIFTTCLEAELVAVAGVYRVIETPLPPDVREQPATVRLQEGGLRIEPLTV